MAVLVTGATGFIGRHLVDALVARGDVVHGVGRAPPPRDWPAEARWHRIDWERAELPASVLAECDAVYHLAGVTRGLDARAFAAGNVAPTRHLVDAFATARPSGRLILVSSQAAAGPAASLDAPVDEATPPMPIEAYGRSKLEAERIVQVRSHDLRWTVVRPTAVYGPRDRDFLAVFRMARIGVGLHALDPDSWISLVHVRDLVSALLLAASDRAVGRTYFVGAHDALQWRAIYDAAAAAVGRSGMRHVAVPRALLSVGALAGDLWSRVSGAVALLNRSKLALTGARYWIASSQRARDELGFVPQVALAEGMRETAEWYRGQGLL